VHFATVGERNERKRQGELIMYQTEFRISLPAMAVAAVIALCVTGGTAALFQYTSTDAPAAIHTFVASTPSREALPMREIVPNRVDVIAVREPARVSSIGSHPASRERS
jgi:hypothetical protein